jgi:cation-transporting ATPase I
VRAVIGGVDTAARDATRATTRFVTGTLTGVARETGSLAEAVGSTVIHGVGNGIDAVALPARAVGGVAVHPTRLIDTFVLHGRRRVIVVDRRIHVEIRSGGEDLDVAAEVLVAAAEAVDGVDWAAVHRPSLRLVARVSDSVTDPESVRGPLTAAIEQAEHEVGVDHAALPQRDHPADDAPVVRDLVGIGVDLIGISLGSTTQLLRFRPPPIEIDLAAALNVADQVIPIRRAIERRIGPPLTELTISFTNSVVQGAVQGPLPPMVDLGRRVLVYRELSARRTTWLARERELFGERPEVEIPPSSPRPVSVPDGPIEAYERVAWASAGGIGGLTYLLTQRLERAASLVQSAMPKAARMGREGFVRELARHLASRGVLVNDGVALTVLDRVDSVVIGAELVGPHGPDLDGLATIARRHDIELMVEAPVDITLPAGAVAVEPGRLAEAIRRAQHEGRVVALVTGVPGHPDADLVLGLRSCGAIPWRAHLLGTDDPADVLLLLEAVVLARRVSGESVRIAMVGAGGAIVVALGNFVPGRTQRAPSVVSLFSALALVNGLRLAYDLGRRPLPVRVDPTPWHALTAEAALDRLGSKTTGLTAAAAASRRHPEPSPPPLLIAFTRAVADELVNPLTPVLAGGAALSVLVGSIVDATLIGGVVAANAVVGGVQTMRTQRALRALTSANRGDVAVVRDGRVIRVDPSTLVQGDVVVLRAGEAVPADCRIVSATSVEVDESSLTGESVPVPKSDEPADADDLADRHSMLYEGSWLAAGETRAVVVATGNRTEARRAVLLAGEAPVAGVEARLRTWTGRMIPIALLGGGALVVNGFTRGRPMSETLGAGVSLAVAAVPEGLPLLSTVAQLAAARRLSQRNVLVRNPAAIEAMGRVDVVCADKTGTLTEGLLALRAVSDGAHTGLVDEGLTLSQLEVLRVARRATPASDDPTDLAHPTDRAVANGTFEQAVHREWTPDGELSFEPGRGYHAAAGLVGGQRLVAVKGAPEVVLPRCARQRGDDGDRELSPDDHERLRDEVEMLARRGLRVLAVASGEANGHRRLDDGHVSDLTFVGLLGLADPARRSAADAVDLLGRAGVRTLMITGDHPSTAEAIGVELGLLNGGRVVTGDEIDASDEDQLARLLDESSVFARVTPTHKVRIVRALQSGGHTVAMTGDGANDAPAIRLADVGIALGRDATPAARNAADIVVLDERIETIGDAIVEGRALWGSVRDAVAVLVGGNLGEIAFTVLGSVIGGRPPMNARQLLLVNLLTDAAPALAIAAKPPRGITSDQLLREGPDKSLASALDQAIAWRAGATATAATGAWLTSAPLMNPRRASTIALATTVGTQLGQTILTSYRDPLVLGAGLGSAGLLGAIVQTPGLSQLFGCTPLDPLAWAVAGAWSTAGSVSASVLPPMLERARSG